MTTKIYTAIIAFAILAIITLDANAQVTIGSNNQPQKGVLLELKTKDSDVTNLNVVTDDENETVDENGGGLVLPRVKLQNRTLLEPFIRVTSSEWISNAAHLKETHAGMMVYNINDNKLTATNDDEKFELGLYVWNGSKWAKLTEGTVDELNSNENRFFYMPSFNIELSAIGTDYTCNLYEQYQKQFTADLGTNPVFRSSNPSIEFIPSYNSNDLYDPTELDYVVTYYDNTVINITNISASGIMTYDVLSTNLTANSFINIVLVVR
jgi:hypothetical protein